MKLILTIRNVHNSVTKRKLNFNNLPSGITETNLPLTFLNKDCSAATEKVQTFERFTKWVGCYHFSLFTLPTRMPARQRQESLFIPSSQRSVTMETPLWQMENNQRSLEMTLRWHYLTARWLPKHRTLEHILEVFSASHIMRVTLLTWL